MSIRHKVNADLTKCLTTRRVCIIFKDKKLR